MKNTVNNLPLMALENIPTPDPNAKQITGLVKESGKIVGYQLSDGNVLDKAHGISLAKSGGIKGVGIAKRNSNEYLKSLPDGNENNNLGNLPTISH